MNRMLCMAIAAFASTSSAGDWLTSYTEALGKSKESDKPVFVYFTDSSKDADWRARFDGMDSLTDGFELVVADKNTEKGAKLFQTFEMNSNAGAVVVERDRKWQYFRTQRQLNKEELTQVLGETKLAKGKPAPSVLSNVNASEAEAVTQPPTTEYIRPSTYCPNCRRGR